jgi:hypothetical protein
MKGGRLDWRIINKTSINVFFKIKKILFKDKLFKHDIILLAETHVGYGEAVNIPGYRYFPICRDQSKNGRYFGGLAILYKDEHNVLFNKIKDRTILVMKGGRLDWRLIKKTSINVFFKIKKILFKDKPVKVRIHDG